jgi:type IV pilus assembly protein PilA
MPRIVSRGLFLSCKKCREARVDGWRAGRVGLRSIHLRIAGEAKARQSIASLSHGNCRRRRRRSQKLSARCRKKRESYIGCIAGSQPLARRLLIQSSMANRSNATRGFTLVELMVVVVIIGVLATLATVGYRRLVDSSRATEASQMIQAIRVAEESHRAETGTYWHVGWSNLCPGSYTQSAPPKKQFRNWDNGCNGGDATWSRLPVHADGPVAFGYGVYANGGGRGIPTTFAGVDMTAPTTTPVNWFVAGAACDIDGTGTPNTVVIGSSFSNQVAVFNEGY